MAYRPTGMRGRFEYIDALGLTGPGCADRRGGTISCRRDAYAQAWFSGVDTFVLDCAVMRRKRRRRRDRSASSTASTASPASLRRYLRGWNGVHAREQLRPQRADRHPRCHRDVREQFGRGSRCRVRCAHFSGSHGHRYGQFRVDDDSDFQHRGQLELSLYNSRRDERQNCRPIVGEAANSRGRGRRPEPLLS